MKTVYITMCFVLCLLTSNLVAQNKHSKISDGLTKEEALNFKTQVIQKWKEETKQKYHSSWESCSFKRGFLKMNIAYVIFGKEPEDGRSLYISMHGGGSAPKSVNDQQWRNQIYLYEPKEGVYVAPRAPWDDWNMWFKPGMDEFFEDLIKTAVVEMNVNPNKVYLMGYSAGGDGVWRMAPRMADRWAAASMMAGHPGESSQVNLLNVPYMIWVGQLDDAYDRNVLDAQKGLVMDSLQKDNNRGYIHETHVVSGKPHWMDRVDTLAVTWMPQFKRNPCPSYIVWRQENVIRNSMYWLSVDTIGVKPGMRVDAELSGNEINIIRCDYKKLTIYFNDDMLNMDKPVVISFQGKKLFKGIVKRTKSCIEQTMMQRNDIGLIYSGSVDITL